MPTKFIPLRKRSKSWLLREIRGLPALRKDYSKLCEELGELRAENDKLQMSLRDGDTAVLAKLDRANAMIDHQERQLKELYLMPERNKALLNENSLLADQLKAAKEQGDSGLQAKIVELEGVVKAKQATIDESIYRPEAARVVQAAGEALLNADFAALLALRPGQETELWRLHGRLTAARELCHHAPTLFAKVNHGQSA